MVQMVERLWYCKVLMVEHKKYLGKIGKLAKSAKKNFGKPKMFDKSDTK